MDTLEIKATAPRLTGHTDIKMLVRCTKFSGKVVECVDCVSNLRTGPTPCYGLYDNDIASCQGRSNLEEKDVVFSSAAGLALLLARTLWTRTRNLSLFARSTDLAPRSAEALIHLQFWFSGVEGPLRYPAEAHRGEECGHSGAAVQIRHTAAKGQGRS